MSEGDGQSGAPTSATALDRSDRYAERLGGVSDRETLHVDQHDRCSLIDRELAKCLFDGHAEFTLGDPVSRICRLEGVLLAQRHARPR